MGKGNGPRVPVNAGPRPRQGTNQEGRPARGPQRVPGSDAHPRVRKAGNHQKIRQPNAAEMQQFNQYFGNADPSGRPKSQGTSQPTNRAGHPHPAGSGGDTAGIQNYVQNFEKKTAAY